MTTSPVTVRPIDAAEHLAFVEARSASFLQTPAWGRLKSDWHSESLGWFAGDALVAAGLVLYRRLPGLPWSLAYLPEGPVTDWDSPLALGVLRALRDHVRRQDAFALRIGPTVPVHRWHAATVKAAMADEDTRSLTAVGPDVTEAPGERLRALLGRLGFRHLAAQDGFSAGQPQFVFQVPLAGRTEEELLAGMNQLWRRNIKKAAKLGVEVSTGGPEDLPLFHEVYTETAARDHFVPRPLAYFQRMFAHLRAEDPDRIRLYLARDCGVSGDGRVVAATTWVRVGGHTWYSYGASTAARRELQGSTAIQWQMMRDAVGAGAAVYDLRGITDTVAADDPHIGLIRFKVGTGGEAVEYVGEWDLALNRLLYRAFDLYLRRRG